MFTRTRLSPLLESTIKTILALGEADALDLEYLHSKLTVLSTYLDVVISELSWQCIDIDLRTLYEAIASIFYRIPEYNNTVENFLFCQKIIACIEVEISRLNVETKMSNLNVKDGTEYTHEELQEFKKTAIQFLQDLTEEKIELTLKICRILEKCFSGSEEMPIMVIDFPQPDGTSTFTDYHKELLPDYFYESPSPPSHSLPPIYMLFYLERVCQKQHLINVSRSWLYRAIELYLMCILPVSDP